MIKRVLIIDDEENIRRMMRLTLEAAGYEVGEASDGAQGIEAYGDGPNWDAVLLDQRMPGMDGLETLRRIKKRDAQACVIMATAYASIELAVDAMKLGATDFVRKPMTPEILRGALAAALSKQDSRGRAQTASAAPAAEAPGQRRRPLIQTLTLNGFEIIRPPDLGAGKANTDEHRFLVKSPEGREYEVIVTIDAETVGYVERMARRQLPANNSFWALHAERLLADYLWNEGKVPSNGRLTLKEIDRDEIDVAARWTGE